MNPLRTDKPRAALHNHCRVSGYRRLWFRLGWIGLIITNLTYTPRMLGACGPGHFLV